MAYKAVVIGTSSGGMNALLTVLPSLPENFSMPVIVVQHVGAGSDSFWIEAMNKKCKLTVKEADEKEKAEPGFVYIAPPNYHLLIERDETFSLTIDERVNYARPSIDVLFESACVAYGSNLIGIILTGANNDGAAGLNCIRSRGGLTIAQDPETAEASFMPASAIKINAANRVLSLKEIVDLLIQLNLTPPKPD